MDNTIESIAQIKQLHKQHNISKEEFRREILHIVIKKMKLNFTGIIGKGEFGDVIGVKLPNQFKDVAVKIVTKENIGVNETVWQHLNHRNILPLLDTEFFSQLDLQWFITPIAPFTLQGMLQNSLLYKDIEAIGKLTRWIADVNSALDYLHKKQLCHLNIKASNILISEDLCAKVFDFHYLNSINVRTRNYNIFYAYRPPEAFGCEGRKAEVEGRAFDIWCFGIMTIEMFTKNYIKRKTEIGTCSWINVYHKLFRILEKKKFIKKYRSTFPECPTQKTTLKSMKNFATECLRFDPERRPTAEKLLNHSLLHDAGYMAKKDNIWSSKNIVRSFRGGM